ncbi:hypothetical protein ACFVMC_24905 [Nocardia sp. NPDC127579]|uniref:hypothetical protein n=1 Tax=Nocardia sp. NPDC127579 TaxID=3345402 RepID=UPI003630BF81
MRNGLSRGAFRVAVGAASIALAGGVAGVALAQPAQPGITTQAPREAPAPEAPEAEAPAELKEANPQAVAPRAPRATPKPEPEPEPKPHAVLFGDVIVPVPTEVPAELVDTVNQALNGGKPRPDGE